ncbi:DUF1521 domain-containing protein [Pacificimonas sp. WHA3]|uniref:DUF1521 domain-containing protein n=1 Tax=Pacificimonas pallii TaxID=2827236 RepID=A0ABS6SFY8_9SPHN|nr:DUF1521 domain-containing protein [Pacificimonas pallii]MBV7256968.1 DUF1521 domain-containing protein [Pacificimonas pallii]
MTTIANTMYTMAAGSALINFAAQMGAMARFGTMQFTPFNLPQNGILPGGGCLPPPGCGCWAPPVAAVEPWAATMPENGRASVDLGDGYTMELNEHSSEIIIRDGDGNVTRIWGDPHVDVNGERSGDFYDTTTFELENGTKITINTEPWGNNPNAYVASQVVVTKGDQGMVIDGISQNQKGDLEITMGQNGRALDFAHDDGMNVHEQDLGNGDYGWTSEFTGERMTRADWDLTKHANRELRESMEFSRDMSQAIMGWLFAGDLGALMTWAGTETAERDMRETVMPFIPNVNA